MPKAPGNMVQLIRRIEEVLLAAQDTALPPHERRAALQTAVDHIELSRRQDTLKIVLRVG